MIRIHALSVEDFRGIRKLPLDFAGRNFAICGPNGTGKSGVVDAIEFAITGSITRLTGQGTLSITLKGHGGWQTPKDSVDHRSAYTSGVAHLFASGF